MDVKKLKRFPLLLESYFLPCSQHLEFSDVLSWYLILTTLPVVEQTISGLFPSDHVRSYLLLLCGLNHSQCV